MSLEKFKNIKLYLGAMSVNVVDSVLDQKIKNVGFISSRRQIDYCGGYVNHWTNKSFFDYVRKKDKQVLICRDHGGPGQGSSQDDGVDSFYDDVNYYDIVHIDPWKSFKRLNVGIDYTIKTIKTLHSKNNNTFFEVGTEESIRKFTEDELEKLMSSLSKNLTQKEYEKIAYCVVQSGVGLDLINRRNTGTFDLERLRRMNAICKKYGVFSKEHNADYLTKKDLEIRFSAGLDAANIAPELGQIETDFYLQKFLKSDPEKLEQVYQMCLNSKKWVKWVDESFNPAMEKIKLIGICCHYVFSKDNFPIRMHKDSKQQLHDTFAKKINNLLED